jgi:hypothetical protein
VAGERGGLKRKGLYIAYILEKRGDMFTLENLFTSASNGQRTKLTMWYNYTVGCACASIFLLYQNLNKPSYATEGTTSCKEK